MLDVERARVWIFLRWLTQDDQGAGRSHGWPRAQRAGQTELHDAAIKIAAIKIA